MTPENLFHQMLGLGTDWKVASCQFNVEGGLVTLRIEETSQLWQSLRCPHDQGEVFCYDHTEELVWRHLNVFEHKCQIHCRLPRARCRKCGRIHRVTPPWEGLCMHFTKAFEALAMLLVREMPVAAAARLLRETDTRVWRMIFAHVDAAFAAKDMSLVVAVAMDEMNVRKGREYITIFADPQTRTVLFATEGRDRTTWERFIAEWEKHGGHRHQLLNVSMDMSAPYQAGVADWCRNAQVVFDKFHIICHLNKAVDSVRKFELRLGDIQARQALRKTTWLWRKNPENHSASDKARLAGIQHKNLWTAKAYHMRLIFQDIYRSPTIEQARSRLAIWCRWVQRVASRAPRYCFAGLLQFVKMIHRHLDGILAHWTTRLTNAYMEGLNSVFSATKRRARGYRSTEHLIAILYLISAKLKIPFH